MVDYWILRDCEVFDAGVDMLMVLLSLYLLLSTTKVSGLIGSTWLSAVVFVALLVLLIAKSKNIIFDLIIGGNRAVILLYVYIVLASLFGGGSNNYSLLARVAAPLVVLIILKEQINSVYITKRAFEYYFLITSILSLALLLDSQGWQYSGSGQKLAIGIFTHKNSLGAFAALGILFNIFNGRKSIITYGVLLMLLLLLFMSKSMTSIVVLIFVVIYNVVAYSIKKIQTRSNPRKAVFVKPTILIWCVLISISIYSIYLYVGGGFQYGSAFTIIGKDASLTGRTNFWLPLILDGWAKAPVFGSGFGNYFAKYSNSWSDTYYFVMEQAHNGYIQVFLDLGLVGVVLLIWFLIVYIKINKNNNFGISLFIFAIIYNISEASFCSPTLLSWLLLYCYMFRVHHHQGERSIAASSPGLMDCHSCKCQSGCSPEFWEAIVDKQAAVRGLG